MAISGIGLLGWIHTLGCILALYWGAVNLTAPKGTPAHQRRGGLYTLALAVAMVLSFCFYHFDVPLRAGERPGPGVFGLFHWLSVATLALVLLGYYASRRQQRALWAYVHPMAMTASYYILIGGLINELFARVKALQPYSYNLVHGQPVFPSRLVSGLQAWNMAAFFVLMLLFAVKVWRWRRARVA